MTDAALAAQEREPKSSAPSPRSGSPTRTQYAVLQLWHWIYHRGTREFGGMRNIARPLLDKLAERSTLARPTIVAEQVSADGMRKWPLRMLAAHARDRTRRSSASPTDGLAPSGDGVRAVSNVVFMGMGEPLYNFHAVRDAIAVLTDGDGLSLSRRRITVSTSSVVPEMDKLGAECGHAGGLPARDQQPAPRQAGAAEPQIPDRTALAGLPRLSRRPQRAPDHLRPGKSYQCSDWETIERFSEIVFNAGYASSARTPRGRDILAACGQLKTDSEKLRARARMMLEESLAIGQD